MGPLLLQSEDKIGTLAENTPPLTPEKFAASPEEGKELIRAFLRIELRSVRSAIIELTTRLSTLDLQVK